jgi:hypothetical protein
MLIWEVLLNYQTSEQVEGFLVSKEAGVMRLTVGAG